MAGKSRPPRSREKPAGYRRACGAVVVGLMLVAGACASDGADTGSSPPPAETPPPGSSATTAPPEQPLVPAPTLPPVAAEAEVRVATPSGDTSGNRLVAGRADLAAPPIEITLAAPPQWVVGAVPGDQVVWIVADDAGHLTGFVEVDGRVTEYALDDDPALPAGAPPAVLTDGTGVAVLAPPEASSLTAAVAVAGSIVKISPDGTVFVDDAAVTDVVALTDGRIVVSRAGEVAFLADPTARLTHGVLGDRVESETIVVLAQGETSIQAILSAPDATVFEAVSPMWADLDGDGSDEILATASDADFGARLVVFAGDGTLLAQSAPIGRGNRWLNQLAVAPTGPTGEIEVIEVRTPHIGGIVRWLRLEGGTLEVQATADTYSTHRIGSRNLDQGLVVDADGDGRLDVVVPSQDQETLAALTRTEDGVEKVLSQPLGARLATNLAGVTRSDGTATLALGTADGRLLIWP